jgi:N-methylhydantoinase A
MATELTVRLPDGPLDADALAEAIGRFHASHDDAYGFSYAGDQLVELVNLRTTATGSFAAFDLPQEAEDGGDVAAAQTDVRDVLFDPGSGFVRCPIYDRGQLRPGDAIAGPAILEQYDSTIVVPPWADARIDRLYNVVITARA